MDDHQIMEKLLREHPLMAFSAYTHGQAEIVRSVARDLLAVLDSSFPAGELETAGIQRAYGLFWLWIIASYEIVRTMTQAKECFSEVLRGKLSDLKRRLSPLRIAFAKQEYEADRGEPRVPIASEASIDGIDSARRDLSFEVRDVVYSVRDLLSEFDSVFSGISREDILHDHRVAYRKPEVG